MPLQKSSVLRLHGLGEPLGYKIIDRDHVPAGKSPRGQIIKKDCQICFGTGKCTIGNDFARFPHSYIDRKRERPDNMQIVPAKVHIQIIFKNSLNAA